MTTVTVDGAAIDYSGLSGTHLETMRRYIEGGVMPGSGMMAILAHDLMAVLRCDAETVAEFPRILRWLRNHAPSECHGSYFKVGEWMAVTRGAEEAKCTK